MVCEHFTVSSVFMATHIHVVKELLLSAFYKLHWDNITGAGKAVAKLELELHSPK